jgi:hypothetical protein
VQFALLVLLLLLCGPAAGSAGAAGKKVLQPSSASMNAVFQGNQLGYHLI